MDLTRIRCPWIISDDTRAVLEKSELFRDLARTELMEVAALVVECSVKADEFLLREGEPASAEVS